MKPKLILISHGNYAEQVYESVKMIVGEIDGVRVITMPPDEGPEETRLKIAGELSGLGRNEPVLIIADLPGGTPCNVSTEVMSARENTGLLTGLNLSMVIEYAVTELDKLEELAPYLRDIGIESIRIVNNNVIKTAGEGYED